MDCYMVTYLVAKETQPSGANSPWDWRPQWGQELVCPWNKQLNAEKPNCCHAVPNDTVSEEKAPVTLENSFTEGFKIPSLLP